MSLNILRGEQRVHMNCDQGLESVDADLFMEHCPKNVPITHVDCSIPYGLWFTRRKEKLFFGSHRSDQNTKQLKRQEFMNLCNIKKLILLWPSNSPEKIKAHAFFKEVVEIQNPQIFRNLKRRKYDHSINQRLITT